MHAGAGMGSVGGGTVSVCDLYKNIKKMVCLHATWSGLSLLCEEVMNIPVSQPRLWCIVAK